MMSLGTKHGVVYEKAAALQVLSNLFHWPRREFVEQSFIFRRARHHGLRENVEQRRFQPPSNNFLRYGFHERLQKIEVLQTFPQKIASIPHANVDCKVEPGGVEGAFRGFIIPIDQVGTKKNNFHANVKVGVIL